MSKPPEQPKISGTMRADDDNELSKLSRRWGNFLPKSLRKRYIIIFIGVLVIAGFGLGNLGDIVAGWKVLEESTFLSRCLQPLKVLASSAAFWIILIVSILLSFGVGKKRGFNKGRPKRYETFVQQCEILVNALAKKGLQNLGVAIIQNLDSHPGAWKRFFERVIPPNDQISLAWASKAQALATQYLVGLAEIRSGKHNDDPILPSNFNLYAQCVGKIMDAVEQFVDSVSPKPYVIIRTLLTKPVVRFYNVQPISKGQFFCTPDWWEEYKTRVAALKHNQKLQLRRLTAVDKGGLDPNMLWIMLDENDVRPIEVSRAYDKLISLKEIKLLDEVERIIRHYPRQSQWGESRIYVIALSNEMPPSIHSIRWERLMTHFHHEYHKPQPGRALQISDKGSYCGYVKIEDVISKPYLNYDDMFIVQIIGHDKKQYADFGVVFKIQEAEDITGIQMLDAKEISETIEVFDKIWSVAQDSIHKL